MPYTMGLLEGFSGRRDQEAKRKFDEDQAGREQETRVFSYLLQSQDPEIRALALSGVLDSARPKRKGGFSGYLGDLQRGPYYDRIRSRMDEEVPAPSTPTTPSAPTTAAQPGSAAMSTNAPVEPGSQVIPADVPTLGGPPPQGSPAGGNSAPASSGLPAQGPAALPALQPPPPPPMRRRGSMVPTAEDVAQQNAHAQLTGRIQASTEALRGAGGTPDEIQSAILGMSGAPPRSTTSQAGPTVVLPGDAAKTPRATIRTPRGLFFADGTTPVPNDAAVVPTRSGAAGGGPGVTTTIRDTPQMRAEYGISPDEPNPGGYWKVRTAGDGSTIVAASEYTPPPAYAGSVETFDPSGVPVRTPVLRGGGTGAPLGDVGSPVSSQEQLNAQALLATVDETIKLATGNTLGRIRGMTPAERDKVVADEAKKQGLGYGSYGDLQRAAKGTAPITPRQRAGGGSTADRVLRRLQQEQGGTPGVPPPPAPTAPPSRLGGPGALR